MRMSQQPGYLPQGPDRTLRLWTFAQNDLLNTWTEVTAPARDCFRVDYADKEQLNVDFADTYSAPEVIRARGWGTDLEN